MAWTMTFESEGLLIVAIYIWLPPASYDVFLTTLVKIRNTLKLCTLYTASDDCLPHHPCPGGGSMVGPEASALPLATDPPKSLLPGGLVA